MWMALLSKFLFFESIELFPPLIASTAFLFLASNIVCFSWFSILEHLFFSYFPSFGNINIHHIHIRNDCLCLNNRLNLCYCHRFRMKHFLHFNKLWTIYHFMSIQTTNVTSIWRCFLCFLTWLHHLYGYHHGTLFLLSTCLHIVICHPIICAMFVGLPYNTLCFCWYYMFDTLWYWHYAPYFYNSRTLFTQHYHLLMLL